jgi:hypothetical protein
MWRLVRVPWWAFWRPRVWELLVQPPLDLPTQTRAILAVQAPPPYGPRCFPVEVSIGPLVRGVAAALWLLLAPPDQLPGAWVIRDARETQAACEQLRASRLDGKFLICARLEPRPPLRVKARV